MLRSGKTEVVLKTGPFIWEISNVSERDATGLGLFLARQSRDDWSRFLGGYLDYAQEYQYFSPRSVPRHSTMHFHSMKMLNGRWMIIFGIELTVDFAEVSLDPEIARILPGLLSRSDWRISIGQRITV